MLVGVRQGGLLRRYRYSQMLQMALATRQSTANLTQRMRPTQLAIQHGHELTPTGETSRVPLCLMLLDRFLEVSPRKKL